MAEKKAYIPGDVASFLAKQSTETVVLEEQSQLRALFDNRAKSSKKKNETVSKFQPKTDDLSMSKGVERALAAASQIKAMKEGTKTNDTPKSRKRSAATLASPRVIEDADDSNNAPKRKKQSANDVLESSVESPEEQTELSVKKVEKKLSKNEMNAQRRLDMKQKKKISNDDETKSQRTVFVGNVALTVNKKTLLKLFKPFGKIEAVRIRSVPVAAPQKSEKDDKKREKDEEPEKPKKLPKRALVIKKEFDPNRHSMNAYVVFEDEEAAHQSLKLNGFELEGLHIRVDLARSTGKHDYKSTIFVGNLPFGAEEETMRKHFDVCGNVENVRIVRDKFTGAGKGFGYVKFADMSSVNLALSMNNQELLGRPLRIKKAAKKPKKKKSTAENSKLGATGKKINQERAKPKFLKKKQMGKGGSTEQSEKKSEDANATNLTKKPRKALQKFGDLKNRLNTMKSSSEGGRKEKHSIKKAMREIIRERKKLSLGRLLTGGQKS